MSEHRQQYKDHTITFNPTTWLFVISGPLVSAVEDNVSVESFREARVQIDKLIVKDAVSKRVKLNITLLDHRGNPVTLTGFHGGHYKMLGVGDGSVVYPNVEWLRSALRKYRDLADQMHHLYAKFVAYSINISAKYGTSSIEQRYSDCLAEIEKQTAAAEARDPAS